MFGNLKNKIGDVTDLKKLSSPQALASMTGGSRQRSSTHTPGSMTPRSRHSRQPSTASLQGSPPVSPINPHELAISHERVQELQKEVSKLKTALEAQQDSALERLNMREQEWKAKLLEEKEKLISMEGSLIAVQEQEKKATGQLREAQVRMKGLEGKVIDMQDNVDQLEGLNTQEMAKIKHMLLNTNSELEALKTELHKKTEALSAAESRLNSVAGLEDEVKSLNREKTELESQIAGLTHRFSSLNSRYSSLEETKCEETRHLKERISTLEQRHSQGTLQETDKVQALMKEREAMEHRMEEARQQLNNIKSNWSEKITALENQIQNLNSKTAEDQADLQRAEKENYGLILEVSALKEKNVSIEGEKGEMEKVLSAKISQQKEDIESLNWQLNSTSKEKEQQILDLQNRLRAEEEKFISCSEKLKNTEETVSSLEVKSCHLDSELTVVKGDLSRVQTHLQSVQEETNSLQDSLQKERTNSECLEKNKLEFQLKLDTALHEKNILSVKLDEMNEKLNFTESCSKALEEEDKRKSNRISELEETLQQVNNDCAALRVEIESSGDDLQQKIEESDVVKTLRETLKSLEDELSEKKQALKVQGQRLADMKKTIQRELKLSADAADPILEPRTEFRLPPDASPTPNAHFMGNNIQLGIPTTTMNGSMGEEGVNHVYLKHVIIKYLTSREYEAVHLTRAVATLLNMTPEEERLLRETLEWKMSWFGSRPNSGSGQNAKTIPPSQ